MQIAVTLKGVEAEAVGTPRLFLNLVAKNTSQFDLGIVRVTAEVRVAPSITESSLGKCPFLGYGVEENQSGQFPSCAEQNWRVSLPLQPSALTEIEKIRNGGDLFLAVHLFCTATSTEDVSCPDSLERPSVRAETCSGSYCRFKIAQSEWEKTLKDLAASRISGVEEVTKQASEKVGKRLGGIETVSLTGKEWASTVGVVQQVSHSRVKAGGNRRITKQRLRRWLPLMGALTVFATFVVKDAVRERVKDLADSLELAQGFFIVGFQDSHLPMYLFAVHEHLDRMQNVLEDLVTHRKAHTVIVSASQGLTGFQLGAALPETHEEFLGTKEDLQSMRRGRLDEFRMARLQMAEIRPAFEKLSRLLENLSGDNKDLHARLSELTQRANDVNAECEKVENTGSQPEKNYDEFKEFENSADLAEEESDAMLDQSNELLQKVFGVAENQRTTMEHRYALFSWCSYVLYTFGWGLGLLGYFLGARDSNIDKEVPY